MNTCRTNRREQIIEQILIVEYSQRFSQHVKYTPERFKRPAAGRKIDYSDLFLVKLVSGHSEDWRRRWHQTHYRPVHTGPERSHNNKTTTS